MLYGGMPQPSHAFIHSGYQPSDCSCSGGGTYTQLSTSARGALLATSRGRQPMPSWNLGAGAGGGGARSIVAESDNGRTVPMAAASPGTWVAPELMVLRAGHATGLHAAQSALLCVNRPVLAVPPEIEERQRHSEPQHHGLRGGRRGQAWQTPRPPAPCAPWQPPASPASMRP
jgi:hypothetical protein